MSVTVETPSGVRQNHAILVSGAPAVDPSGSGARPLAFAMAIFVSAYLLFQVQLLLGKEVLRFFGGAAAVWTVCVLVFQLLFLAAYGYSHGLATWLPLRKQVIGPGAGWRPQPGANPTWTIAEFLIGSIGLPFFLLSATSPLMQHWLTRSGSKGSPYRLYALSNTGSLLGLLSYPFLVEPNLGLLVQGWAWAA